MSSNIAILGAGGIGGSIAAYLAHAGHRVTVIDQWPEHIMAIKQQGLTLTDADREFTVPVRALQICELSGLRESFDVVYLSVKSYDTLWSTQLIAPHLSASGFILPAMNALNDEAVAQVVGYTRVVGCVPTISAGVYEPGHVVRTDGTSGHAFTVGELSGIITPRVREVVETLDRAVGPSDATTNIWGVRWSKMVWNCAGNALAGLTGGPSTLGPEQRALHNVISAALGVEAARVAVCLGVALEPTNGVRFEEYVGATTRAELQALSDRLDRARAGRGVTPEQARRIGVPGRPSLLQDVIKTRRTEVDYLNGYIAAHGEALGLAVPLSRAITEVMHELEAGQLTPGGHNLVQLEPYLPA